MSDNYGYTITIVGTDAVLQDLEVRWCSEIITNRYCPKRLSATFGVLVWDSAPNPVGSPPDYTVTATPPTTHYHENESKQTRDSLVSTDTNQ